MTSTNTISITIPITITIPHVITIAITSTIPIATTLQLSILSTRHREHARRLFQGKPYAVCSFFGSTEASRGADPKSFPEEVRCRLLIFLVRLFVFGSTPDGFFKGRPTPFAHFSGPPTRLGAPTRQLFRRTS